MAYDDNLFDSNPGEPLFHDFRKLCRRKVLEIGRVWTVDFAKLKDQYPALCVQSVLARINEYEAATAASEPARKQQVKTEGTKEPLPPCSIQTSALFGDPDADLMRKFYDGDVGAFEALYNRKKSFKGIIGSRYPGLDADSIYDDSFQYIYETGERRHPPYDYEHPFDAWFWWIANFRIKEKLREIEPVAVLRTPYFGNEVGAELPDSLWSIRLADDIVEMQVPSRSLKELQTAIRILQSDKRRTRWNWSFDVVLQKEGDKTYLVFRIYSFDELDLASATTGKSLLFPVAATGTKRRGEKPHGMAIDDAADVVRTELFRIVTGSCEAICKCKPDHMTALYLCDLRGIDLGDAVHGILHAGQPSCISKPNEKADPPYGTVGQWRSHGKQAVAERVSLTTSALDELLRYLNHCYYDPRLGEEANEPNK